MFQSRVTLNNIIRIVLGRARSSSGFEVQTRCSLSSLKLAAILALDLLSWDM